MAGGKNSELTVCQLRDAASPLVQSLWDTGRAKRERLQRTAETITRTQQRLAAARHSHSKRKRKKLAGMGIDLAHIRCCIFDDEVSL